MVPFCVNKLNKILSEMCNQTLTRSKQATLQQIYHPLLNNSEHGGHSCFWQAGRSLVLKRHWLFNGDEDPEIWICRTMGQERMTMQTIYCQRKSSGALLIIPVLLAVS